MRHEAIYATHSNVVRIDDSIGAFDENGNQVNIDESLVQAKIAELQAAEPLRQLRIQRNQLLASTDWRMTEDYPFNDKEAWKTYRQALRDLPANNSPELDEFGNLTNIIWPEEPA